MLSPPIVVRNALRAAGSAVCFVAFAHFLVAQAADTRTDWPQYRGSHGDGIAAPQPIAKTWGPDGPPELWRRKFGSGFSTVAAVGKRLYTMGAPAELEEAFCLDAHTGETIWRVPLGPRFADQFGDGPRATPTVDGDTVFVVSSTMHLAAIATATGEVRWHKELLKEFGIEQPRFGFSASVLVAGERAVLEVGAGEGKAVVAFARDTGDVVWTALDGSPSKSTPLLAELDGVPQLIFNRPAKMAALSLDGDVLWTHEAARDIIAMAHFVPPDLVLTSSAYMGKGTVAVRVKRSGEDFTTERAWVNRRFRNHFNNAVLVNGHLYGFDNSTLRCLNAETGEIAWSQRGFGKGSLIACDNVLFVLGDQGILALVAADPASFREVGRVQAMQDTAGRCWTSPTLAAGRLFVRNLEEIVAYDVGAPAATPVAVTTSEPDTKSPTATDAELALPVILERYTAARGGLARWREVSTIAMKGTFRGFSESGPFTLQRRREDLYRFEYTIGGKMDARGRDGEGLWWRYHLFEITEPARVKFAAYHRQMKRESMFEPALLDATKKGIEVALVGRGNVDGQPTIDLDLKFPDGSKETWRLHAETFLEVAIDSTIVDMTQAREPMPRRTFCSDFRTVDGLVLPFRVAMEFGARLEEIAVERATVDPKIDATFFDMPRKK
ncbi:MAG: PQQ-like beta-propeller repeat protein [bacterium]|nr:PQQ-like beta-propeller repeat protein [bacterium]